MQTSTPTVSWKMDEKCGIIQNQLLVSFIGAICVLFYSLANISKTIRKVRNAFPNERFAWVFFWNLITFAILLLVTYTISLVREIDDMEEKKDSMTQE